VRLAGHSAGYGAARRCEWWLGWGGAWGPGWNVPIKYASFMAPEMGPLHRVNTAFPLSRRGLQMIYTDPLPVNPEHSAWAVQALAEPCHPWKFLSSWCPSSPNTAI
jgi:hypothetical protein